MEGSIDSDGGAMIGDGVKSVAKRGAPKEDDTWPYEIERFRDKPSKAAYAEGKKPLHADEPTRGRPPRRSRSRLRRGPAALHRPQLLEQKWGMDGYFTMPYPYLLQQSLSRDFWTIRRVEGKAGAKRKKR